MKIFTTTNYHKFRTIEGNREVNKTHLKRLAKSVSETSYLDIIPIIVNEDFEVIDGQHRLEVARELGLPVNYVVAPGAGLKEVQLLNANERAWLKADYLESYIKLGNQNYVILKDFMKKFGLPLTVSADILMGPIGKRGSTAELFKNGKFVINNLRSAIDFAEKLVELKPFTEPNVWRTEGFVSAVKAVYKKVSRKLFIHKLEIYGRKVKKQGTVLDYIRLFEDILNFRSREQIRLYAEK